MSDWVRQGGGKERFLRFKAGETWEGIYNGFKERENPFYDPKKEDSPKMITDYMIDIAGEDKILSSTARSLSDQLKPLIAPKQVKIDCIQKALKKFYNVWTMS